MDQATHQHPHDGTCAHCAVDPRRNRSSLVAWIVAAVAVIAALVVFFSRAGSVGSTIGGFSSIALLAILACPLMMGAIMLMMRKGH